LEGLAVYWNCGTEMYSNLLATDLIARMKKEIANKDHTPSGYTYSEFENILKRIVDEFSLVKFSGQSRRELDFE